MGYKLNGSPLALDVAFTDSNGTQYPSNWLRNSSAAERAAVPTGGITWEAGPPWYDQQFYWSSVKPKDIAKLKPVWIKRQKETANNLLARTDWLVVRKAEAGTAIPSATATYRTAVRTQCGLREATINACADTDKLCATIRGTLAPTVAGTASNGATEKFDTSKEKFDTSKEVLVDGNSQDPKVYESFDPKQYESFDPKKYNDVTNPDLLEDWPTEPS